MGIFHQTNLQAYWRAVHKNYDVFAGQGLDPDEIVYRFITDSPQSGKKPLLGFNADSAMLFSVQFADLDHTVCKQAYSLMVCRAIEEKMNISEFNIDTVDQFIDLATEQMSR